MIGIRLTLIMVTMCLLDWGVKASCPLCQRFATSANSEQEVEWIGYDSPHRCEDSDWMDNHHVIIDNNNKKLILLN